MKATRQALRRELNQEAQAFASATADGGAKGAPYRVASWAGMLSGADFNSDFDGREKYGIFREMLDSDPIIGLGRMLIDGPLVAANWRVDSESDELRGAVESLLFAPEHDQALTWEELLLHAQLSVWLGCYLFERVWHRGADGLDRCYLSPRPPDSVWRWKLDGRRLAGIDQEIVDDSGVARYVEIPGGDLVHFVFDQEANNLEGRSILRPLYGEFISKREGRMWRNIMAERSQGFLGANPTGEGATGDSRDNVIEALAGFTNHEDLHFVGSPGWEINFLQTVSDGIERCQSIMDYTDRVILQRLLLTHMAQGMMPSGSRSVAETQEKPYWNALGTWASRIQDRMMSGLVEPFIRDNFGARAVGEVGLKCDNLQTSSVAEEIAPFVDAIARGAIGSTPALQRHVLGLMRAPDDVVDEAEAHGPDPSPAPAEVDEEPSAPGGADGAGVATLVALNGAQIQAALTIVEAMSNGAIGKGSAKALLQSMGLGGAQAAKVLAGGDRPAKPAAQEEPAVQEESAAIFAASDLPAYTVDPVAPRAADGVLSREPEGAERAIEFDALGTAWEAAAEDAAQALERFRARFIPELEATIQKWTADGKGLSPEQIKKLEGLRRAWRVQLRREIVAGGMAEFTRGRADVIDELARLPLKPNARFASTLEAPTAAAVKRSIVELADEAVERYVSTLVDTATGEVRGQVANAGRVDDPKAVGRMLGKLSRNQVLGGISNAIGLGYNQGRESGAAKSQATYFTYSTLFEDGRTCPACREHELEVGRVGSEADLATRLPLRDCYSTRAGSSGNRCRCIKVYSHVPPEELTR